MLNLPLFVCGISLTSGQLFNELFPDCTRSCFSQVVLRRQGTAPCTLLMNSQCPKLSLYFVHSQGALPLKVCTRKLLHAPSQQPYSNNKKLKKRAHTECTPLKIVQPAVEKGRGGGGGGAKQVLAMPKEWGGGGVQKVLGIFLHN